MQSPPMESREIFYELTTEALTNRGQILDSRGRTTDSLKVVCTGLELIWRMVSSRDDLPSR